MQERWKVTAWLACIWFVSLLYGEYLAFVVPSFTCTWPALRNNETETEKATGRPIRIALIADPQLTDRTTHGMALGSLALRLTQLYSDIYMLRAFRTTVLQLKPDMLIFLGDYFDGGPDLSKDEWHESLKRLEHMFDQSHGSSKWRHTSIPVYYLAGNHDLGYVQTLWEMPAIVEQYETVFGSTNSTVKVGGVEFIFINAQSLDGPKTDVQTSKSWSFIQQLSGDASPSPRVLLTHIPLYRPDNTVCGPHRASSVINQRIRRMSMEPHRISYQNYLTEETSQALLDSLKPAAVFSGHDHDQCETTHVVSGSSYTEHTVGTFSWQNGNIFPSFMLVSVAPESAGYAKKLLSPVTSSLCFLPVQLVVYIWYVALFAISIVAIFSWPAQGVQFISWERFRLFVQGILSLQGPVKEKVEDAETEWEMVWDAEGAMHLISKGHVKMPDNPQGLSSDVRGTAQARPAAKRHAANETETKSLNSEDHNFSGARPSKIKGRSCMRKLLLGMGPLAALVAWSLGFYVILLMKDWSETTPLLQRPDGGQAFG